MVFSFPYFLYKDLLVELSGTMFHVVRSLISLPVYLYSSDLQDGSWEVEAAKAPAVEELALHCKLRREALTSHEITYLCAHTHAHRSAVGSPPSSSCSLPASSSSWSLAPATSLRRGTTPTPKSPGLGGYPSVRYVASGDLTTSRSRENRVSEGVS